MGSAVIRQKKPALALAADSGTLPLDVLFEVLLRFPANVLCRLRLVCRSWRSLTSDPVFARAHASRHPLLASIHIGRLSHEVRVVDLSGSIVKRVPVTRPSYALNTQLDMVCVSGTFSRSQGYVLNLATGEVVAAYASLLRDEHGGEALISPFLLGHVPSTGEVKVFYSHTRAVHGEEGDFAVQVCSITTLGDDGDCGRWRVTPSPPANVASSTRDRVVIGGVAYFLLSMRCTANVEPDAIAVFDLVTEEWRPATLRGPLSSRLTSDDEELVYHRYRYGVQLAAVDGCLVTVHNNDHCQDDGKIIIWDDETQVLRAYDPRANKLADLATLRNYFFMNMYQGNLLCPGLQR
ncbi:uncharacterized protein [Setaria viridis]|uniref:F-box domain-containing protein n=1 Tax=Setaria viridis TaxID=4556 RepID=A0A4U6VQ95_SETVI|nr:hypothetical protein SEVIR_2G076200v2 [Setaria viridis]